MKIHSRCIISFTVCLLLLLIHSGVSSQSHSRLWFFGYNAGIDFTVSPAKAISSALRFSTESGTTLTDGNGQLLFVASYNTIYNRKMQIMNNGSSLIGNGGSSAQAPLVLQNPADSNQYYVFQTSDETNSQFRGQLRYSVIDMCGDEGNGEVLLSQKNILIPGSFSERITAIPLRNGEAYWILTSVLFDNTILAFYLDKNGLRSNPVSSAFGNQFSAQVGLIVVNHQKNKLAYTSSLNTSNNGVWMMDFDTISGMAFNQVLVDQNKHIYGICFSPNDQYLYYSYFFVESGITQHDIQQQSNYNLVQYSGNYIFAAIVEGPDGLLYIAKPNNDKLAVILDPDLSGVSCNFRDDYFQLASNTFCYLSLQNTEFHFKTKQRHYRATTILGPDTTICHEYNLAVNKKNLWWSTGSTQPEIKISNPGIYWMHYYECDTIYSDTIRIEKIYELMAYDTIYICKGDSVLLYGKWYKDEVTVTDTFKLSESCDSLIHHAIFYYPPSKQGFEIRSFCFGDSLFVEGIWYKDTTSIILHSKNYRGCDSTSMIRIQFFPEIKPVKLDINICYGDSSFVHGAWYNSDTTIRKYKKNTAACDSIFDFSIHILDPLFADIQIKNQECHSGQLTASYSGNVTSWQWSPAGFLSCTNCLDPFFYQIPNSPFYFEVSDQFGCRSRDSLSAQFKAIDEEIYIPNAFSPNGDQINDLWEVRFKSEKSNLISLAIFSRWGERMYYCSSQADCMSWNGNFENQKCIPGVYVYVLEWLSCDGIHHLEKGDFTLVR